MKFHDDMNQAFKPLIDHLKNEYLEHNITTKDFSDTLSQYMYMGHDDDKTYYKHKWSRDYFNISHDEEIEGELENWRFQGGGFHD